MVGTVTCLDLAEGKKCGFAQFWRKKIWNHWGRKTTKELFDKPLDLCCTTSGFCNTSLRGMNWMSDKKYSSSIWLQISLIAFARSAMQVQSLSWTIFFDFHQQNSFGLRSGPTIFAGHDIDLCRCLSSRNDFTVFTSWLAALSPPKKISSSPNVL